MKQKHLIVLILVVILCVSLVRALVPQPLTGSTGRCVLSGQGDCFLVLDGTPVELHNRTGNADVFGDLATGDRLFVLHGGIRETFPAQTYAYFCLRIGQGGMQDIPQHVMDGLTELGWLSR